MKSFLKNATAVGIGLLTCILLLEVVIRVWKPSISYKQWRDLSLTYHLDEHLYWKLEPRDYWWGTVNQHNFRGKALPQEKTQGIFRIAVVGGSSAFDLFKRDHETWSSLIQKELLDGGVRVEILNAGTPGYSTWHSNQLLQAKLHRWNPDLVIVYHRFNDWGVYRDAPPEFIERGYRLLAEANHISTFAHPGSVLDSAAQLLPNAVDFIRAALVRLNFRIRLDRSINFWCNSPEVIRADKIAGFGVYRQMLTSIASFLQTKNTKVVFVQQPTLFDDSLNDELTAVFEGEYCGFPLVEIQQSFNAARKLVPEVAARFSHVHYIDATQFVSPTLENFHDEVHLTHSGSQTLAHHLALHLKPILVAP